MSWANPKRPCCAGDEGRPFGAAPRLAFTRLKASRTSLLGISNGFASATDPMQALGDRPVSIAPAHVAS